MTKSRKLMFFIIIITLLLPSVMHAQTGSGEVIRSFHSDITVNKDSSLTITETIDVTSAGDQIKHGIYRDFPTIYGSLFKRKRVGFMVLNVQRDGMPEPYVIKNYNNSIRIYIGDEDTLLPLANHSYKLTYQTDHQLGYFKDHDELYWNVTGNEWLFPISKASATINLPSDVPKKSIKTEGYTGVKGAKGKEYISKVDATGKAVFQTTSRLEPREGFTLVVSWQKGHVTVLASQPEFMVMLNNGNEIKCELFGLLLLLGYYLFVWILVGKDPPKGSIVPQYEPPDGLSPAAVRYIRNMKFDYKCIAANLIDMAVKKSIKISDKDGSYIIHKGKGDISAYFHFAAGL